MEDCLIIGIDIAEGKDISCMSVIRKNGEEMQVINQLFNKEAYKSEAEVIEEELKEYIYDFPYKNDADMKQSF